MAQNTPFVFGGGSDRAPPAFPQDAPATRQPSPHQHPPSQAPAQIQPPSLEQQMAFAHNMQASGFDLAKLAGVTTEQFNIITRLYQSGALALPPPAGTAPLQAVQEPAVVAATPANGLQQQTPAVSQAEAGSTPVETDKEDGEVEDDGEGDETPALDRGFLRPPPTGPRNNSTAPRGPNTGVADVYPGSVPAKRTIEQAQGRQPDQGSANGQRQAMRESAAKMFVLELIKAGKTFEDIEREVSSPESLARLFGELGLPVPSKNQSATPQHPNNGSVVQARKALVPKKAPPPPVDRPAYLARLAAVKTKKSEVTPGPAAVEVGAKPAEATEVLPPPVPAPSSSIAVSRQAVDATSLPTERPLQLPIDGIGDQSSELQTPSKLTKVAANTEKVRQRLEALKARQAAKEAAKQEAAAAAAAAAAIAIKSSPAPATQTSAVPGQVYASTPAHPVTGAGLGDIGSRFANLRSQQSSVQPGQARVAEGLSSQTTSAPPSATTPKPAFGGLPGLFMAGPPELKAPLAARTTADNQDQLPQRSHATGMSLDHAASTSRKRAVAADFDDSDNKPAAAKRPFGQSRNASEDESIIIQISEDEMDDEDGMDVSAVDGNDRIGAIQTMSFRDVGPLRDFPPQRSFFQTQASAPGTPGGSSPGGAAYQQRMKAIEDMKRKIAEAEAKAKLKANGKTTPVNPVSTPDTVAASSPVVARSDEVEIRPATEDSTPPGGSDRLDADTTTPVATLSADAAKDTMSHSRTASTGHLRSASALARQQEKERLRLRLLELERDENHDLDEAVKAAATELGPELPATGGPALSTNSALPGIFTRDATTQSATSASQEFPNPAPAAEDRDESKSEDGELSDGSGSRFYDGDQEINENQQPRSSPARSFANEGQARREASDVEMAIDEVSDAQPETTAETLTEAAPVAAENTKQDVEDLATIQQTDMQDVSQSTDDLDNLSGRSRPTADKPQLADDTDESMSEDSDDPSERTSPVQAKALLADGGKTSLVPAVSDADPAEKLPSIDDDLASELQPATNDIDARNGKAATQDATIPKVHYTPYQSPLTMFKDYRYHSDYSDNVAGGYKSLSYSHNIDANKQLCPYETTGGKCNDPGCQYQHFKDMGLADNDLLQTLGTKNMPAYTPAEVKKWKEGLAVLVRSLRADGAAKDANSIAKRIAQYRREFVGDPTRVINLGPMGNGS